MKQYLAADIGGTFIKYGVVTAEGDILESGKVKTPKELDGLLMFLEELYHSHQQVEGLALSCPGAVSNSGVIYGTSALPYLHGPNIKQLITQRMPIPVYMENDANCAGHAEIWKGNGKGKKDVLVVVIGTGIGGAVIKDGKLHKGTNLHGGEFGYMVIDKDAAGNPETWSIAASTVALVKETARLKKMREEDLTGEEIFGLAERGDKICKDAVDRFYRLNALGIYNLQYLYDPEVILIGGGISTREELIEGLNIKLDELLAKIPAATVKPVIDVCLFRQHANLLGAVYGMMDESNAWLEIE